MGILAKLFRQIALGETRQTFIPRHEPEEPGEFGLEVVGESHYQPALEEICGGRTPEGADEIVHAVLIPEPNNPYDSNAVKVEIDGKQVGHLAWDDAKKYRAKFARKQLRCKALISAGWERQIAKGKVDRGHFSVCLDFEL